MAATKSGVQDIAGRHVHQCHVPGQATANTATEEWPVFEAMNACRIKRLAWIPRAAVSGAATNHFSLNFENKGTAGTGTTDLATEVTYDNGTDETACNARDFTLSTTDATITLAAGEVITLKRTLVGTGLAMPPGLAVIEFEPK